MEDRSKLTLNTYLTVDFTYAEKVPFEDRDIATFINDLAKDTKFIKDYRGVWHNKDCILRFRRKEVSEELDKRYGSPLYDELTQ
ncbi:hypothetical protein [Corticicoccus populi]|uniref:Uncharacterized protein n=1 Tax=Corticicoccus populi TaxID=1812821 RepID=A0ABW5WWH7_9STAP